VRSAEETFILEVNDETDNLRNASHDDWMSACDKHIKEAKNRVNDQSLAMFTIKQCRVASAHRIT